MTINTINFESIILEILHIDKNPFDIFTLAKIISQVKKDIFLGYPDFAQYPEDKQKDIVKNCIYGALLPYQKQEEYYSPF